MTIDEYILSRFGAEQGEKTLLNTRAAISALAPLCNGENKSRQKTMREQLFPRIALYQTLKRILSPEDAKAVILDYTKNCICPPMAKRYAQMEHVPGFFRLFKAVFLHIMRTSSNWDVDIKCNEKDKFSFDVHKCLWYDTCVKCGCPELCSIFCDTDFEVYRLMKKTEFSRSQTIGTGGEKCDFTFTKTAGHRAQCR